jgi:hypothetical protein
LKFYLQHLGELYDSWTLLYTLVMDFNCCRSFTSTVFIQVIYDLVFDY